MARPWLGPDPHAEADAHSVHTIGAVHRILRSALNEAVRRRRLASNPALIARSPGAEDVEIDPFSVEESRHEGGAGRPLSTNADTSDCHRSGDSVARSMIWCESAEAVARSTDNRSW